MNSAKACQCLDNFFDKVSVTASGDYGYYLLHAKNENQQAANEGCLNQVKAEDPGNGWASVPLAKGYYVLRCHYKVCMDGLAALVNILGEPGFIGLKELEKIQGRRS